MTAIRSELCDISYSPLNIPININVPVYRGQSNAGHPPRPSLYRDTTDREFEKNCLSTFSFIFDQKFLWQNLGLTLPPNSAKAAAQHYGIQTDLLDITADPAIAVYFASRSNNRKRGETAAVFMFDLALLLSSGVKLILPPPIVERLYLQRGGFLALPEDNITQILKGCVKITFPFDPNFKFLNHEKHNNILLPDNKWLQYIADWSRARVLSKKLIPHEQTEIDALLSTAFEQFGYPNTSPAIPDQTLIQWIENFENMAYWYAIRITDNYECLISGICNEFARSNPEIIRFMVELYGKEIQMFERMKTSALKVEAKKRWRDAWVKALENQ